MLQYRAIFSSIQSNCYATTPLVSQADRGEKAMEGVSVVHFSKKKAYDPDRVLRGGVNFYKSTR